MSQPKLKPKSNPRAHPKKEGTFTFPPEDTFFRLPGLYRRWELSEVLLPGIDYHFFIADRTQDGIPLFTIARRDLEQGEMR